MYDVLIVDDEAFSSEYVCSLLDWEKNGFVIRAVVNSAMQAMSVIAGGGVDIVLMDVMMPGLTGGDLARMIHKEYPRIKMLALSGYDDYDYVRQVLLNGASDYMLKHRLSSESLLEALGRIVNEIETENMRISFSFDEKQRVRNAILRGDYGKLEEILVLLLGSGMDGSGERVALGRELFALLEDFEDYEEFEDIVLLESGAVLNLLEAGVEGRKSGFVTAFTALLEKCEYKRERGYGTPYSHAVATSLELINDNYGMNITLEDAASVASVSAAYLSRVFHKEVGRTFTEQLAFVRVRKAKLMIRKEYNLKEIAYKCGFKSYSYFFKVFKKITGITPTNYLETIRKVKNLQY